MPKPSKPEDKRTLVDRIFDRLRNNRVAAIVIVVGVSLMALASFTESIKRLYVSIPRLSKVDVQGLWESDQVDLYGAGQQTIVLRLKELDDGRLTGSLRFYSQGGRPVTPDLDLLHGKREADKLAFSFDGGARKTNDSGKSYVPVPESITGKVSGDAINFVYERDDHAAVPFSAHRPASAASGGA